MVLAPMTAFAGQVPQDSVQESAIESGISTRGVLYEDKSISISTGEFVTYDFSTLSSNSNDINVYFKNNGSSSVTVTLQRLVNKKWSDVDSLEVGSNQEDFKTMAGTKSATYRLRVKSSNGATVKGWLKANQL